MGANTKSIRSSPVPQSVSAREREKRVDSVYDVSGRTPYSSAYTYLLAPRFVGDNDFYTKHTRNNVPRFLFVWVR